MIFKTSLARGVALVIAAGFALSATAGTLTGPVTEGERGGPYGAVDVADRGYQTEEYFLAGSATAYELAEGEHTPDGRWNTRPAADKADFKTRLLVVRPEDPDAFNGTVIVLWLNVSAGFEVGLAVGEALRGYAWVGVSAQKVGIDGFPQDPQGLKAWDAKRYGSLVHPGDAYSYDIFTQVARAVGPERDTSDLDPMGGLEVERMIAVGPSQSAARLRTYINGVHQHTGVFDGYIPFVDFGRGVPFTADSAGQLWGGWSSIRSDLDVPVIVVNSETEVTSYYGVREDDSDRFRLWEIAGTSHVSVPRPEEADTGFNWLSYRPVYDASIRHLHRWITDGVEPPRMPRVEVVPGTGQTGAAARPQVVRDDHGNAVGGIRLPDVEVPTASHSGFGVQKPGTQFGFIFGVAADFDGEKLASLYPDSGHYLKAWRAALDRAVEQGIVLPEDAPAMADAAAAWAARLDVEQGADEMAERVTQVRERLMLTDEQVEKIGPILRKGIEAQAELFAEQGFARGGARSRQGGLPNLRQMRKLRREIDAIRESTLRELGEVLDEKQLAEYREIQKERQAELRKRMRERR